MTEYSVKMSYALNIAEYIIEPLDMEIPLSAFIAIAERWGGTHIVGCEMLHFLQECDFLTGDEGQVDEFLPSEFSVQHDLIRCHEVCDITESGVIKSERTLYLTVKGLIVVMNEFKKHFKEASTDGH